MKLHGGIPFCSLSFTSTYICIHRITHTGKQKRNLFLSEQLNCILVRGGSYRCYTSLFPVTPD